MPLTTLQTLDLPRMGLDHHKQWLSHFAYVLILLILLLFAVWSVSTANAQTLTLEQTQREKDTQMLAEIEQQRARIAKENTEQRKACYQRFAVNACLLDIAQVQRQRLTLLREKELTIQERQRRILAAQRLQAIADKTAKMKKRQQADAARLALLQSEQALRLEQAEAKKQRRQQQTAERLEQYQARQKERNQPSVLLEVVPNQTEQRQ